MGIALAAELQRHKETGFLEAYSAKASSSSHQKSRNSWLARRDKPFGLVWQSLDSCIRLVDRQRLSQLVQKANTGMQE